MNNNDDYQFLNYNLNKLINNVSTLSNLHKQLIVSNEIVVNFVNQNQNQNNNNSSNNNSGANNTNNSNNTIDIEKK
ncbi:hypothetical protein DICPUDRAFT_150170 [Dictyostelium purpureum]|uniref:Uncharacterized protein n=1 Tax=Dictyostelium purpureum TaxID=5786 RepID=F0ZFM3_DICPU|nr:uncharacterized protein DICPUDRAFT_150170 [Dictyostelium purpureum]EGC37238.1 hypothetical protein DICPUDRAFT_150170 [Dictyostelium purpureum]|eukprot:XP_003286208.1 hypothetical protein DICPUDRAFT_150170 [Dictyostelium purpureum]